MINVINKNKFIIVLFFSLLLLTSCSKEVMDEINRIVNANFGNYTKSNPLIIIAMPFKPAERFDAESRIGELAWNGAVNGLKDIVFFTDGEIVYKGIASNSKRYLDILRSDTFWKDLGTENQEDENQKAIKLTLNETAIKHEANAIIYGLYEGDDSSLNLTVYLYTKNDDLILKENTSIEVEFMELKRLVDALKGNANLTPDQKALRKLIHEKTKVATVSLVRKYTEGR